MVTRGNIGSPFSAGSTDIWDSTHNYLRILIRDLVTEARVGLHPWEQHDERPTRLIVNVELFARLHADLKLESQAGIIDYDPIHDALKTWPARPHTLLLETLLSEVVDLCFANPRVSACRVSIVKPDIFNDAAGVGVEAYIRREDRAAR